MRLTKENIMEYAATAMLKDKIYVVTGYNIRGFRFIAKHDLYKGFYAYSDANVQDARLFSVFTVEREVTVTDYEEAKELMWKEAVRRLNSINDVYFSGNKEIPCN